MKTLTLRVSDQLVADLDNAAQQAGISKSEIIRTALAGHLKVQKFKSLRKKIMPFAEKAGYLTDEDVFNDSDLS
ncbi:MAG: CopG family transcriptional regulator [Cyclobacteriaceae bacterium]